MKSLNKSKSQPMGDDVDILNFFMMRFSIAKSEENSKSIDQILVTIVKQKVTKYMRENGSDKTANLSDDLFKDPKELLKIKMNLEEKLEKVNFLIS